MRRGFWQGKFAGYVAAAAGVAAVTGVCAPFAGTLKNTTVALLMLLVVLFVADFWGSLPALFASLLAALAFDYYFLPPLGAFTIADPQDWLALGALVVTALTVGELSARARRRFVVAEAGRSEAQAESAYHRALLEASLDPLVAIGRDGKLTDVNAATEQATGRSRAELIGTDFSDYFTDPEQARAGYDRAFKEGFVRDYPLEIRGRDGTGIPVLYNASVYRDGSGAIAGVFAAARDVSGIQRAEREIRHLASFPQGTPVSIVEFDRARRVTFINPAMQQTLADCAVEDPGLFIPAEWAAKLARPDFAEESGSVEIAVGGRSFDERLALSRESLSLRIWATDITERKGAARELERLNRTLRTLSSANQTLVRAASEADLLRDMCRVLVDVGGYRLVWIGFAEQDADKSVHIVALAGHNEGYLEQAKISWADTERGGGPTGTAIRTGEPQICRDFATDPRMAPWRDEALRRGYASSAALPLRDAGGIFGVLTIYAPQPEAFGRNELALFEELAADLAYGITALRTSGERAAAVRRLSENLEDTIAAIAATIERRDPYTAGHQRRVAKLAAAIAAELALPEDQSRGIYLAGLVHDIGKINVPAEILGKPGTLTDLEKDFVRTHAQGGFDIIKGIDFPWPIAETVLQHHERLDGSGYPRGLAGAAVIMEARILGVADVTEAIMAHRPYRPALGLDAALAEIEGGRGGLYDAAAVDACLALFRRKGFRFE
jgi:PAS domain S-box-containing protein/putative nucleotidyltransferase with HDIG domain